MSERIICPTEKKDTKTVLLSPSVGLVRLLVSDGQQVQEGQIIAELWRLNTCFLVILPEGVSGTVIRKSDQERFYVAFHEEILDVDRARQILQHESNKAAIKQGSSILSPMDGMFYLSPSPADPPFIKVGDEILPGQTLGLIEVMKCFYPFKYQGKQPTKLLSIYIKNASPVTSQTKVFEVAE